MSDSEIELDKMVTAADATYPGPLKVILGASERAESGALLGLMSDTEQPLSAGPTWAEQSGNTMLATTGQGDSDGFSVAKP
ncbi:hypothetical protein SAMN04487950_0467 [Halogranum rubrum]|uniref:Uncharacterized protein n=1 Tax=Halogranum rubrum TaxID=553466 RepID=A0A1I4BC63_9EURY|nr:hypothetical protein [Halogranum rubrum]SFK66398.1 hypothetical protein SAMN04487950_0467 [Halogranum rubrum]